MTSVNVSGESDRNTLWFISFTPLSCYRAAVLVNNVLGVVRGAWSRRVARLVLLPSLLAPVLTLFVFLCLWSVFLVLMPSRVGVFSGGESALLVNGGSLADGPSGATNAVADDADPDTKRRKTEVGLPSPSAPQPVSDAAAPAPTVGAPQTGALQAQGSSDAPSVYDGPPGASTDFAASAASAIAAAAASSSEAAPTASEPQDKTSSDSVAVPSSGTAPATEPIDDEDVYVTVEDEDGEYDPTASQYVPGVQAQSFGGGGLGPPPQTRPIADQGSGGPLQLEQVPPLSTAEVLKAKQPNGHSAGEGVVPPAVTEQAAPLAVKNETSSASGVLPESATPAGTASVVPVAAAGATGLDAVAPDAVGTERSATPQPESSSPAATLPPNEPQPLGEAPPAPMDVDGSPPTPPGVVLASAEAGSQPRASTPPLSSAAETEVRTQDDSSLTVQPPSPPIGSSSAQEPLPESVEIESEEVRRSRRSTCVNACVACRLLSTPYHCVTVSDNVSFVPLLWSLRFCLPTFGDLYLLAS